MGEALANVAVAAAILLVGLAGLLLAVGVLSWSRVRHGRLAWVSVGFAALLVEGLFLLRQSYAHRGEVAGGDATLPTVAALGLAVAVALYFAVLKRS